MLKNLTWLSSWPVTHPDIFENEDIFSDSAFCPHVNSVFENQKVKVLKNGPRSGVFLNACLLFSC